MSCNMINMRYTQYPFEFTMCHMVMSSDLKVPVNTRLSKDLVDKIDLEIKRKSVPSRTAMIEKALEFYFETFQDHDERLDKIEVKLEDLFQIVTQLSNNANIGERDIIRDRLISAAEEKNEVKKKV